MLKDSRKYLNQYNGPPSDREDITDFYFPQLQNSPKSNMKYKYIDFKMKQNKDESFSSPLYQLQIQKTLKNNISLQNISQFRDTSSQMVLDAKHHDFYKKSQALNFYRNSQAKKEMRYAEQKQSQTITLEKVEDKEGIVSGNLDQFKLLEKLILKHEQEIREKKELIEDLKKNFAQVRQTLYKQKSLNESNNEIIQQSQNEITNLRSEKNRIAEEQKTILQNIEKLKQKVFKLEENKIQLCIEIQKHIEIDVERNQQITQQYEIIKDQQKSIDNLKLELDNQLSLSNRDKNKQEVHDLRISTQILKDQVVQKEDEIKNLQDKLLRIQDELSFNFGEKIQLYSIEVEQKNQEIIHKSQQIEVLDLNIIDLKKKIEQHKKEIEWQDKKEVKLVEDLNKAIKEIELMKIDFADVGYLQQQNNEKSHLIREQKNEIEKLNQTIKDKNEEITDLKEKSASINKHVSKLTLDVQNLTSDKKAYQAFKNKLSLVQEQSADNESVQKLTMKISSLIKTNSKIQLQLKEIASENEQFEQKNEVLEQIQDLQHNMLMNLTCEFCHHELEKPVTAYPCHHNYCLKCKEGYDEGKCFTCGRQFDHLTPNKNLETVQLAQEILLKTKNILLKSLQ